MDTAFEHEIRQRAYAIWVSSGMNEGEAEVHWLHAERAVRTEADAAVVSTAKGRAKSGKAAAARTAAVKGAADKVVKTKTKIQASTPGSAKPKAAAKVAAATKTSAASRRPEAGPVEAVA